MFLFTRQPQKILRISLTATAVCLFLAVTFTGFRLGMTKQLHLRYTAHAIPAVISHMFYQLKWDYTAYEGVAEFLVKNRHNGLEDVLDQACSLTDFNRKLRFFPYDDKGYASLTLIAFKLFGVSISSIFWCYVLLLGVSVAAMIMAMIDDIVGLILLNVTLGGICAALPAFPVSDELASVTNPRAIGILSSIALVHLLYYALIRRTTTAIDILAALVQASIITLVVFSRSSEIWQVVFVLAVSGSSLCFWLIHRHFTLNALISGLAMAFCMLGLSVYQRTTFHPNYFQQQGQNRLMWHNAGLGFALHPKLASIYNLRISDGAMFEIIERKARSTGTLDGLFTDDDKLLLNPVKDFVRYDQIARSVVLEIVKDHPVEAVTTFTFYKPLYLIRTHLAAMGVESGPPPDFEASYLSATERSSRGLYLNPFRLIPFTVVLLCVLILYMQQEPARVNRTLRQVVGIIALVWAGTLIPSFASYPLYHIIGSTFAASCSLSYALLIGLLLNFSRLKPARWQ